MWHRTQIGVLVFLVSCIATFHVAHGQCPGPAPIAWTGWAQRPSTDCTCQGCPIPANCDPATFTTLGMACMRRQSNAAWIVPGKVIPKVGNEIECDNNPGCCPCECGLLPNKDCGASCVSHYEGVKATAGRPCVSDDAAEITALTNVLATAYALRNTTIVWCCDVIAGPCCHISEYASFYVETDIVAKKCVEFRWSINCKRNSDGLVLAFNTACSNFVRSVTADRVCAPPGECNVKMIKGCFVCE